MKQTTFSFKAYGLGLASALALAFSANAHATLADGIVDIWTVNVATAFDTTTICDSNNDCTQPNGITSIGNTSLRWGSGNQSGLDITGTPSSQQVTTNGAAVPNVSITHLNQPITGATLKSVDILSTLTLTPFSPSAAGLPASTITFKVSFLETDNDPRPGLCADGGVYGVGINSAGCADIYVTDKNGLNNPFFYDLDGAGGPLQNQLYFISFFELTSGLNPLPAAACLAATGSSEACLGFRTAEATNTTVQFGAVITTEKVIISVPEPGILGLLGLGLAGMAFSLRRKV